METALLGKYLAAGMASIALLGSALAVGNIFASYLAGALRNPGAADSQKTTVLLGAALAEAAGLFGFVIAMILLFVV